MSDSNVEHIKTILAAIDPALVSVTADGKIHVEDPKAASALRALPFAESFPDGDSTNSQALCVNVKSCAD